MFSSGGERFVSRPCCPLNELLFGSYARISLDRIEHYRPDAAGFNFPRNLRHLPRELRSDVTPPSSSALPQETLKI